MDNGVVVRDHNIVGNKLREVEIEGLKGKLNVIKDTLDDCHLQLLKKMDDMNQELKDMEEDLKDMETLKQCLLVRDQEKHR
ncbi:XH/XS domain-containing protein [Euphorbia peplus]|nr:XH/XS domain-containing protein [Euphorbia peplus]